MTPLTAIALRDDRPGHYHCSEAILAAAARLRPIEITRVPDRLGLCPVFRGVAVSGGTMSQVTARRTQSPVGP